MEKFTGNKILVLGCSGSGKSTFSRELAARTGLPLIHLDNIWWRPDQTHITGRNLIRNLMKYCMMISGSLMAITAGPMKSGSVPVTPLSFLITAKRSVWTELPAE